MNGERKYFVLLRILEKIQQDNADARDGINKSIATVCNSQLITL